MRRGRPAVRDPLQPLARIGSPKSADSARTIPISPYVVNTLRQWQLACPHSDLDLVFGNGKGEVEWLQNIDKRGLHRAQIDAGIVDADGSPKYTGMGHSTLALTADTYSHLFEATDDGKALAEAERQLMGLSAT